MTTEDIQAVVERHRKLAIYLVRHKYLWLTKHGYDMEDLIQEAIYAIIRAAPAYRPSFVRESTYYSRCITNWLSSRVARPLTALHRKSNRNVVPLDKPVHGDDGEMSLLNALPDPTAYFEKDADNRVTVQAALDWLETKRPQQAKAIRLCYMEGMGLIEAGEKMCVTRSRVDQHVQKGIKNLRRYMCRGTEEAPNEVD